VIEGGAGATGVDGGHPASPCLEPRAADAVDAGAHAVQSSRSDTVRDRSLRDAEDAEPAACDHAVLAVGEGRDCDETRAAEHPLRGARDPYNTRNVPKEVSRATIDPPLSRASRRYSTASADTRKPSRITGIPGG